MIAPAITPAEPIINIVSRRPLSLIIRFKRTLKSNNGIEKGIK